MRRRQLTLLLLLLTSVALWLTRGRWLPLLLAQIPLLEARSSLLQAIEALVSLAVLLLNAALVYFLWLSRREEEQDEDAREMEPLRPTSPEKIRARLGRGGRVNWIDRNRGLAYHQQGALEAAIADYTRAIEREPQLAGAYNNRAGALIRLGRLDEAEADCRAVERLAPGHPCTHACWGQLAYARGDHETAVQR